MRKVVLVAMATLLVSSVQAQFKPVAGSCGLEVQFRPFARNTFQAVAFENDIRTIYGVSPWFFVTDRVELRADFGFGFDSEKDKQKDPEGNNDMLYKWSSNAFGLRVGAYYHFKGTERISPYLGANVGFGMAGSTNKITNWNFASGDSRTSKGGMLGLNVALATGFNWYIVNGLYLGADIGLGFVFAKPQKMKITTVISGEKTTNEVEPTESFSGLDFIANPAIRLGWKF